MLTPRLQVWELRTGICVKTLRGHTAPVLAIQAEADKLVSGGGDKTIRVWQVHSVDNTEPGYEPRVTVTLRRWTPATAPRCCSATTTL